MNRWALAVLLAYVAVFGPPMPRTPAPVVPDISTPSTTMRAAVQDVTAAMKGATYADRATLADLFLKTGKVVAADKDAEQLFGDTRSLREYIRISTTIGWQRLAGNQPGKYVGLGDAIEQAFVSTLGLEAKAVDQAGRDKFSELCTAVAWAALQR